MVNNLFKKGINAFVSQQTNIFSAAFFIFLTTIISQLLGLLKNRMLLSYFGASNSAGIFLTAFSIPDFIFLVYIGGALSSSFIPIFSEYLIHGKKEEAEKFASALITIGTTIFLIISAFIVVFAGQLAYLIAPRASVQELVLMANFIRIIQITQTFFVLGTIFTAILQSYQHFLIPGIASALYNFGIIIGLLIFAPILGIYSTMVGVLIGSLVFCIAQIPLLFRVQFHFHFIFRIRDDLKKFFYLMLPTSLTVLVNQAGTLVNVFFANYVSARSYLIFDIAQSLAMAPVLLFGQSIAQASFPTLVIKKAEREEFLSIFMSSFNQILYLTLPFTAILIVLRIPAVRLIYGVEKLDWNATTAMGATLALYSLSTFAQSLLYLFSRTFYAFKNTKTPFIITVVIGIINVIFSYYFIIYKQFPIYYLALANSIAFIIGAALLFYLLDRKLHFPRVYLGVSILKILAAAAVMGLALYIPIKLLDQLVFDTTRTINLIILTGIATFAGLAAYVFFTWLLDIEEAYYIIRVLQSLGNKDKILDQIGELIEPPKPNS